MKCKFERDEFYMYISSYFNKRNIYITQQLFSNNNISWISPQVSTESLKIYLFCIVYTQIHIHTLTYDFCITYIIYTLLHTYFYPTFSTEEQNSCESKTKSINKQDTNSGKKMYIYTHTLYLTDTMSIHLIHSAY